MRSGTRWFLAACAASVAVAVAGCGGGTPGTVVRVSPAAVALDGNAAQSFTASVTGNADTSVAWTATGGTITVDGNYTAPAVPGTYEVRATSNGEPKTFGKAVVTVGLAPQTAVRIFSVDKYVAGASFTVSIQVKPASTDSVYAVEDAFPVRWAVSAISDGGDLDSVNGKVKWLFTDNTARTLTYTVTPPAGETGERIFAGSVVFDSGAPIAIGGSDRISP